MSKEKRNTILKLTDNFFQFLFNPKFENIMAIGLRETRFPSESRLDGWNLKPIEIKKSKVEIECKDAIGVRKHNDKHIPLHFPILFIS